MKSLLTFATVLLLNGAFLYPLWFYGIGRPVSWPVEGGMIFGGVFCFYLLIRYRRQL